MFHEFLHEHSNFSNQKEKRKRRNINSSSLFHPGHGDTALPLCRNHDSPRYPCVEIKEKKKKRSSDPSCPRMRRRKRETGWENCIQNGLICRARAGLRVQRDLITRPSFFPPRFSELENIPPPQSRSYVNRPLARGSLKRFPMLETLLEPATSRKSCISLDSREPNVPRLGYGASSAWRIVFGILSFRLNCFRITSYMSCQVS